MITAPTAPSEFGTSVDDLAAAYSPQELQKRYKVTKELVYLLALQKVKSEMDAATQPCHESATGSRHCKTTARKPSYAKQDAGSIGHYESDAVNGTTTTTTTATNGSTGRHCWVSRWGPESR